MRFSANAVYGLLFADDCDPNTTAEPDVHGRMGLFATGCAYSGLAISKGKTAILYYPTPKTDYNAHRINVNGALPKTVENFAYVDSMSSHSINIGSKVAHQASKVSEVIFRPRQRHPRTSTQCEVQNLRGSSSDNATTRGQSGRENQSLTPQLPSENPKAEMAGQDSRHGTLGTDRDPRHQRLAEISKTAMQRPPPENGFSTVTSLQAFADKKATNGHSAHGVTLLYFCGHGQQQPSKFTCCLLKLPYQQSCHNPPDNDDNDDYRLDHSRHQ
nr:unnamed protein product [Spirometra erinaceieuropaei]